MPFVTISTPTYNRAYCIGRLYESLCRQTCKDFEWLIVDDGSTDNTEELVKAWIAEKLIDIRYIKQHNGGKHRAINRGLDIAAGEYFYMVDSDDYVTDAAVAFIKDKAEDIRFTPGFAGIVGLDRTIDGKELSGFPDVDHIDSTSIDICIKHHINGDKAEVVKTNVLRQFRFPEIEEERFCPEAIVWNRIADAGLIFRYYPQVIKIIEYLPDGLTAKIIRIRANSPIVTTLYYSEYTRMPVPIAQRVKGAINYWRFWFCKSSAKKPSLPIRWWWLFPVGLAMHINDLRKM